MRLLVTAGPTREFLDPVRFLSNRSSGRMGFAIARAGAERGHSVTLVAGPVALATPTSVERVDVVTACDMLAAVENALPAHDALVMSAAVADWRPRKRAPVKLKKSAMADIVELVSNPDILRSIAHLKEHRIFVGFAAETGDPSGEAQRKLHEKGVDLIVANDVMRPHCGFESETNQVTLFALNSAPITLPLQSKLEIGYALIKWIEGRYTER